MLLPVRNGADTLAETLDSIRAQTHADFRCLILDDGSTDGTAALAEAYVARDPRFVVQSGPPRGIAATLNAGLSRVEAPFVARIDADDVMEPRRLGRQLDVLSRDPSVDVVSSRVTFFGDDVSPNLRAYERWLNGVVSHAEIVRDLFVESPLPHPSVTMRTGSLRAVGGYRDLDLPEDYDLWLRGFRAGWTFAKIDEVLVRIRDHERRLTKTDPRYLPRAFLQCKVEHLIAWRELEGREIVVWGAGRDGKRAAKALRRRGVLLRHLVDIAPTKVGKSMLGVPVLPPESLREEPRCFVVAAVGIKGARAEIREALDGMDYREGTNYICFG